MTKYQSVNVAATLWAFTFLVVFAWSAYHPFERGTWVLEVAPAVLGAAALLLSRRRFPLTPLLYVLILIHCIILLIGGHYTYAEVPLFDWIAEHTGSSRNNYDKLGHFAQGFVPVMIAREITLRLQVFNSRAWANFFVVCFALAFSAFYELIEWWVALASAEGAEAFLGTQGYVWDTQSDMGAALIGAIAALVTLSSWHDSQLSQFIKR
ncbi:DUF2238 domain-containing protein [Shewanella sp. NIFS-20-20]|uniref:DUF2238 domain-containing protein n=1 Tax=Shewanella sp. NIFS-20-20 TaxID=2853806 RepID=UPI001C44655E|nr:DUF2238 domain-containing protein [Shewanella sp. NIFS-20-20]MBV7316590.1 DUF2238 domain-containing protein [Shewanella sp. NIFS-20-20]